MSTPSQKPAKAAPAKESKAAHPAAETKPSTVPTLTDAAKLMAGEGAHETELRTATADGKEVVAAEELVTVYHLKNHGGSFLHDPYRLDPGASATVPKHVADLWLSHKGAGGIELVALAPANAQPAAANELAKLREESADKDAKIREMEARLKGLEALVEKSKPKDE